MGYGSFAVCPRNVNRPVIFVWMFQIFIKCRNVSQIAFIGHLTDPVISRKLAVKKLYGLAVVQLPKIYGSGLFLSFKTSTNVFFILVTFADLVAIIDADLHFTGIKHFNNEKET